MANLFTSFQTLNYFTNKKGVRHNSQHAVALHTPSHKGTQQNIQSKQTYKVILYTLKISWNLPVFQEK